MATEKDIKTMTDAQLGTELMSIKNAVKGLEAKIRVLVKEAEERGFAGKDIPTVGGDYVVHLSSGVEDRLDMDLATEILGAEKVAGYLEDKRMRVETLTKTDLKGLIAPSIMEKICKQVSVTIKAEVKEKKK